MAEAIPDLWPADLRVDTQTPTAILNVQKELLSKRTQGILRADVSTSVSGTTAQHTFNVIAPALSLRSSILTVTHDINMFYPVVVAARCFLRPSKPGPPLKLGSALQQVLQAMSDTDTRIASTQDEFIALLREVLQSAEVKAVVTSLIARSNEAANSVKTPTTTHTRAPQPSLQQSPDSIEPGNENK